MVFSSDYWSSLKGASSGILEYFVGAHSLNILSRLESLSGGPSGGGYNCWQLRPHGKMEMAVPSHHPGHLTWDQGCIWYFGRWEVHRNSPNHSQTRSFNRKSQNTSLLVIDLEHRRLAGLATLPFPRGEREALYSSLYIGSSFTQRARNLIAVF